MYKKILTGSRAFFNEFEDFNPHDTDYILLFKTSADIYKVAKSGNIDYFYKTEENFLKNLYNDLKNNKFNKMCICSVLVPSIQRYFNYTLDDIKFIEEFIPLLDDKHKYLGIIYNSYKENNKFELTKKQLNTAYKSYKKSHQK